MARLAVGVVAAALILVGCENGGSGTKVPASWRAVDTCLERHPAFAGRVEADDKNGPVDRGELLMTLPRKRSGVEAYRFPSHATAVSGMGPPGVISYYGPIALHAAGLSREDEAYLKRCFLRVYGDGAQTLRSRPPQVVRACLASRGFRVLGGSNALQRSCGRDRYL